MQVLLRFRPTEEHGLKIQGASVDSEIQTKLKNLNNDLFEDENKTENTEIVFIQDIVKPKE